MNKDSSGVIAAPKSVQALHNVNLLVECGRLLGVAGEIGSGKSSLINAILGEVCIDLNANSIFSTIVEYEKAGENFLTFR